MRRTSIAALILLLGAAATGRAQPAAGGAESARRIALVAGTPSHGPGEHEFNAGILLLEKWLDAAPGVEAEAHLNGWPANPSAAFDGASAIVLFMDGGGGHPVIQDRRLAEVDKLMARGVGLVCLHYAVEVPRERGGEAFLRWIGGYYEKGYSINPHWDAAILLEGTHPILRGVTPWTIRDEWYYNIRFPEDRQGWTPILSATPPDETRRTEAAQAHPGRNETLAWAVERKDGGRGFGFTGAHFHRNWGDPNFRKVVLNAIVWAAGAEVPQGGVESSVTEAEMNANLDPK